MPTFRTYSPEPLFGDDYRTLRDFLVRLDGYNYTFGRWDWMITHGGLDKAYLPRIGLWEDDGTLVAVATYDCEPGSAYIMTLPGYEDLKEPMLGYARGALAKGGMLRVLVADDDQEFVDVVSRHGFSPTSDGEAEAVYEIDLAAIDYTLPKGFAITDMAKTFDLYQYQRVLYKGFDGEAEGQPFVFHEEHVESWRREFNRPNVDPELKVAVVAPDGNFAAYCGMWVDPRSRTALVEPVATDPEYRKMGLGRTAVLEAIRRCGRRGAARAVVGSSQEFYYRIGFRPFATSTFWEQPAR